MTTLEDIKSYILSKATAQELQSIVDCYKVRHKNLGQAAGLSFKYGDRVWFDAGRRGIIKGKFIKLMSKNAQVMTDLGSTWTVSPHLLQRDTAYVPPAKVAIAPATSIQAN